MSHPLRAIAVEPATPEPKPLGDLSKEARSQWHLVTGTASWASCPENLLCPSCSAPLEDCFGKVVQCPWCSTNFNPKTGEVLS